MIKRIIWLILIFSDLFIYANETLVLTIGESPPATGKDLPNYGFLAEIVSESFAAVDIDVEYVFYPWIRGYNMVVSGDIIGSVGYIKTKERMEEVNFSDSLWSGKYGTAFYLNSLEYNVSKTEDLSNYRVILLRGYSYGDYADRLLHNGSIKTCLVNSEEQAFKMLLSDRADIFLGALSGYYVLDQKFLLDKDVILHSEIDNLANYVDYHVIISKNIKDSEEIVVNFNKGLQIIKESGLYINLIPDYYK